MTQSIVVLSGLLWLVLVFPRAVLGLLINMFDDVSVSVLIANHNSTAFSPVTGVLQGSVLSPHLYSLYINSLPSLLRSGATGATMLPVPGADAPIAINSLLFADDVAVFGSKSEVQRMLDLAAGHSVSLGYRWKPSKCAVLGTAAALAGSPLVLYNEALPVVDEFTYLGMPFRYKGLHAPGILSLRSAGAVKTMALLNSVGVNRNGFSLLALLSPVQDIYFVLSLNMVWPSPISLLVILLLWILLQNRLVGMFVGSTWVNVAKAHYLSSQYQTSLQCPGYRFALRADTLPDDCLLVLLRAHLHYTRLDRFICENPLYQSLPDPVPSSAGLRTTFAAYWQDQVFTSLVITFCTVRALDPDLIDALPPAPPGVHRIDHALNCLPTNASAGPPDFWPALLNLLYAIDCLVHPLAVIAPDPDPASLCYIPYASAARKGAQHRDPARTTKRRLAAGRMFQTTTTKGQQGYQYVYLGRSGKILRSEVRYQLRRAGIDTGRVLDICFPATGVIGILLHIQYVEEFLACMRKCEADHIENFQPLDPNNIADPKYADLAIEEREQLIYEFTNTRALQTLSFLRPLNVSGVGKYFVSAGWISQEELDIAVSEAIGRLAEKEPKKAKFLFKRQKEDHDSNGSAMEL
ncbi:uncharacterized protein ATC70_003771 [Mucor velutinosus]|uniref:Reverse transcriptase domain-containing protein n=1 Tax=Mucor velutinosus TaxID=708070 RepID=A0AAN7D6U9_9FUNG|nr:hypothetical protein ATC70_003771 [Mucor velutinosus]